MKATLRYKYVRLLHTRLPLYNKPIGTTARRYVWPDILTLLRPSRSLVVRARTCVAIVENIMCQHVNMMGYRKPAVSISHLLKRMVRLEKNIQLAM